MEKVEVKIDEVPLLKKSDLVIPTIVVFVLSSTSQLQILYNQYLSAKISLEYLTAFSMISLISLLFQAMSFSLGETCTVMLSGEIRIHKIRQYFGGALLFYLLIGAISGAALFLFKESAIKYLALESLPGIGSHFFIWITISYLYGINSVLFYAMAVVVSRSKFFFVCLLGLILNLLLGPLAIQLVESQNQKFMALNLAFIFCLIVFLAVSGYFLRNHIILSLKNLKIFTIQSKNILPGYFLRQGAFIFAPLFYTEALMHTVGGESMAAYSVAIRILDVFTSLFWAIELYGMNRLSEIIAFRGEPEWFQSLKTIRSTAIIMIGVPILITISLIHFLLTHFYGIHSSDAFIISAGTLLSFIPSVITLDLSCKFKIFEKQIPKAIFYTISTYGIGLGAIYFFANPSAYWIAAWGIILPVALESLGTYYYDKYLGLDTPLKTDKSGEMAA